jgi:2-polyprenyl-3-methyl-5-hydroxy-6-metoxy-1,4-benzoquinol methylase
MKEDDIRKRETFNKYLELSAKDVDSFFGKKTERILVPCPACASQELTSEFIKNKFQYVSCRKCETLFVSPSPSLLDLSQFYANSPSTSFWVNEFFKPVAEARREKIFKPRAEYIARRLVEQEGLVIGDIGAGFGLFLEELKKIKPSNSYVAIEPSSEMADICRKKGLGVVNSTLEDVDDHQRSFDILSAFELLEHLFNPRLFLEKVYALLKPRGYFIFTTLNGLGFDIQILWEKSKSVSPPHHLNFFNTASCELLAESVGFRVIEKSTPGLLDWDIIEGGFQQEAIDPGRFWKTLSRYGTAAAKTSLQDWIQGNGLSSHMRMILQK